MIDGRALFERAVSQYNHEQLWDTLMDFESRLGDAVIYGQLEQRRKVLYPEWNTLQKYAVGTLLVAECGSTVKVPKFKSLLSASTPAKNEKAPALESFRKELYQRPDLLQWNPVKLEELKERDAFPIPAMLHHFLSLLTPNTAYDGPVLHVGDMTALLRDLPLQVKNVDVQTVNASFGVFVPSKKRKYTPA